MNWTMVNGSELNFSEIGTLDDIKLYGGGRGGGMSYDIKPATTEYSLTDSETSPRIEPSNLIMNLIGRIWYEHRT